MKLFQRFFQTIVLVIFFSIDLSAETIIDSGSVSGVWNKSGSPYKIMGNISVDSGTCLHIQAGTGVVFEGRYKMHVLGAIQAIGAIGDSICFAGKDTGWIGIVIGKTMKQQVCDSSAFRYCRFSGARYSALKSFGLAGISVSDCRFYKNENEVDDGGAIHALLGARLTVSDCHFIENTAKRGGAAIRTYQSNVTVLNSTFIGNRAGEFGGAVHALQNATNSTIIDNCDFIDNHSAGGGAVFNRDPKLAVFNSTFINNSCTTAGGAAGGAVYSQSSSTSMTNCLFANNSSFFGGAVYTDGVDDRLFNCTVVNNFANTAGGIFLNSDSKTVTMLQNNVFYGNVAASKCNQIGMRRYGSLSVKNCIVEGGIDKDYFNVDYPENIPFVYENNLDAEPHFKAPNDSAGVCSLSLVSDWRLVKGSPGIDAGSGYVDQPPADLAGSARVSGSAIDIGAYEYQDPTKIIGGTAPPQSMRGKNKGPRYYSFFSDANDKFSLVTLSGKKLSAYNSLAADASMKGTGVYVLKTSDAVKGLFMKQPR